MNNEKLLILLAVIASCTTVSWAHNKQSNRLQLRRIDVQRDEPRTSRNEDHRMVAEEEEEEEGYVPASFIFDYDPSNGNGASYHGHAIEMMAPVEVPEYDWRDDDSRGISELDRDGLAEGSQELLSAESDGQVQQCGDREIDPRHAVCCDGLVFRKIPGAGQDAGGKCCGRIAYDDRYFTCCQGRAIVRRSNGRLPLCCGDGDGAGGDALPDQCRPGYQNNATGLGSTCCRSANPGAAGTGAGAWKCCIRGQGCCADERSTAIDVPGFRPACCHLANEDLTSQCCATTYEKIRVLPDCCSGDRLRPVCCKIRHSVNVRCCPGTVGYCCGVEERPGRATIYPPRVILETRHPIIHPQPVTDPPRPTHTDRLSRYPVFTYPPRPIYTTRLPYHPYPAIPPRTTQPPYPRYTTARGAPGYSTVRYSPGQVLEAGSPECCRGSYQQRSCCLRTRSPTCCSSSLPRCCFTLYFNITCCGSHMQQQQQQQGARNPQVYGGGGADREAEVRPLSETELRQTNERRQNQAQPPTNGHVSSHHHHHQQQQPRHGGGVTLSCCRLETREATACCRNGYQESGRLPLCCVSSPGDTVEDIGDAPQSDAAASSRPRQHRNRTSSQRPHHQGQGHALYACNGVGFDADQFICCENILRKRIGFRPACCNNAVYDSYLYKCCKGKIRTSCGSGARPRKRHA